MKQEIIDGEEAKRILDSEVYQSAIQKLADGYQSQWMNSRPNDVNERERVYVKLQILADFVSEIKSVMQTGQMAKHEENKNEAYKTVGTHY